VVGWGGEREKERGEGGREGGRRTKDEERAPGKGVTKGGHSSRAADKILGNYMRPPHFRETFLERFRCCQPRAHLSGDSKWSCNTIFGVSVRSSTSTTKNCRCRGQTFPTAGFILIPSWLLGRRARPRRGGRAGRSGGLAMSPPGTARDRPQNLITLIIYRVRATGCLT
jgi:hypothetical protein